MISEAEGKGWAMLLGGCLETIPGDFEADHVIADPPYSARTHGGQAADLRGGVGYPAWEPCTAEHYARVFAGWARGWCCIFTDHVLAPAVAAGMEAAGRYVFSPLACVQTGSRVRLRGDGPAQWATWLVVSRPRSEPWASWGALPGAYVGKGAVRGAPIKGAKPLDLMRAVVRDYTRPGDLILDPCAGTGTTILAAALEGREGIGCEEMPDTFLHAVGRLRDETNRNA